LDVKLCKDNKEKKSMKKGSKVAGH
jgi:hypothetical protein